LTPVFLLPFFNSTSADFGCLAELGSIAWQPTWHVFFHPGKNTWWNPSEDVELKFPACFDKLRDPYSLDIFNGKCNAFRLASYSCPFHNHSTIPWDKIV
jgi:hypothetical protein